MQIDFVVKLDRVYKINKRRTIQKTRTMQITNPKMQVDCFRENRIRVLCARPIFVKQTEPDNCQQNQKI